MTVNLRPVDRFVAAGGPTGALLQPRRMIAVSDENLSVAGLLLEVTLEAKVRVALREQPLVDRAVRRMAAHAAFPHRFMLEHEWPALRGVALETSFVMAEQCRPPTRDLLGQIRSAAFNGIALVWIMAIRAADFSLEDGMMMRQLERRFHFRVALETSGWRFSRIDNKDVASASGLHVQAAWAVTRFAANVLSVCSFGLEPSVSRRAEIARNRFMARGAFFRANEFRTGNARRRHDRVTRLEAAAGEQDEGSGRASAGKPPKLFAAADEPSSKPRMQHGPESGRKRAELATHFYR